MRLLPALPLLLLFASLSQAQTGPSSAAEVKLIRCDRLFLVPVIVDGRERNFLLDTGATSILNLAAFTVKGKTPGDAGGVEVASWTGTHGVAGRILTIKSLSFAGRELKDLRLSAIDLSALDSGCGRTIEGLLGADLLERLGALIDLTRSEERRVGKECRL